MELDVVGRGCAGATPRHGAAHSNFRTTLHEICVLFGDGSGPVRLPHWDRDRERAEEDMFICLCLDN